MNTIYYFPIDAEGIEVGDPIPISLTSDGQADLSQLPATVRSSLQAFGVPDELHQGSVFPAEGERFLARLIAFAHPYLRFRSSPTKAS